MNRLQTIKQAVKKVQPKKPQQTKKFEKDSGLLRKLNLDLDTYQAAELDYAGCWEDIERELERD